LFDLNANGIYFPHGSNIFLACRFASNTDEGVDRDSVTGDITPFIGCIFESNGTGGASNDVSLHIGSTFAEHTGASDWGVKLRGYMNTFVGCRFTGNGIGMSTVSGAEGLLDYCYFDNDVTEIGTGESVWKIPDKTNTEHVDTTSGDAGYGYETGEYNLDPDVATYFNEGLVIPSS
jgi:hypothetical protein